LQQQAVQVVINFRAYSNHSNTRNYI